MAGTISSDLTALTGAESTSDSGTWTRINGSSSSNPAADTDAKIQNTACLATKTGTDVSPVDSGLYVPLTATFAYSGKHVFTWRNLITPSNNNSKIKQGSWFQISSDSGFTTNYKRWFLEGSDTDVIGGWKCYAIDPSGTSDSWIGTLGASGKTVAWGVRQTSSVTGIATYTDAVKMGTGVTINDGTSSTPATFADILATDNANANAWGILTASSGIYYGIGKFNFGTLAQSTLTYFKDTNQVLVFRDMPVASSFYEILAVGSASYATTLQLGNYSGGLASNGCVIRGQSAPYTLCYSYPETANNAFSNLYSGSLVGAGQSFTGNGLTLSKVVMFLKKTGTPTGNAVAKIYTHSGTYGSSSIPTGAALATSDNFDVSTLTITSAPNTLTFSGANQIPLTNGTYYILTIEYSGGTSANYLMVGNTTSGAASGNYSTLTGTTWTAAATTDMNFYVYTIGSHAVWKFTASNSQAVVKLYSSTFSEMQSATFNSGSEMRYCTFSNFATITTNGILIDNCTFQNVKTTVPISGTYGLIVNSTTEMANITNSKFINCNRAIKITTAGTYTFSNLTFSGNAYDVENSSNGLVTINVTNGGGPSTYINTGGGSTSIINAVTLKITVLNKDNNPINLAQTAIYKTSDNTQLMNGDTNSSGIITTSYNYLGDTAIYVRVRKNSPGDTRYLSYSTNGTITSSGFTLTVTLTVDPNV